MMVPKVLNCRYKVIKILTSGGFGETFLAEDTQMPSKRKCVIKQLKPVEHNPQIYQLVQERFQREAALLEELSDGINQIPHLYAYFNDDGQFYLVQEYIEGYTLGKKLRQEGRLSETRVKEILINILPVLEYIHAKHIVHRDIKPDNILIRSLDKQPVLIDFGAVKETMHTAVAVSENSTGSIVIGTPGFMSSEQTAGRPVYSSDLYSLGLTAIYLLTGRMPQELPTNPSTGEIIWQDFAPNITPDFAAVLDKAIQFHPRERFLTAKEMLLALRPQVIAIPPTIPQPCLPSVTSNLEPPTVISAPLPEIQTQLPTVLVNQRMKDWQKATIIGGVIGVSVISGMAIINKQPPGNIQAEKTLSKSSDSSSENTTALVKTSIQNRLSNQKDLGQHKFVTSLPNRQILPTQKSAQDTLKNYYSAINNREYRTAWNYFSIQNKNNQELHPNGFNSFTDWWKKVSQIEVHSLKVQNISNESAIVDSRLHYSIKSGRTISQSLKFFLIWDVLSDRWLINKVERI